MLNMKLYILGKHDVITQTTTTTQYTTNKYKSTNIAIN